MSLKNQLESLLFSSGKAMEEEQLASLTDVSEKEVKKTLKELQADYVNHDGALKVYVEGSSWKLLIKDDYVGLARRIVADTELSRATLETLAIIAYNQPTVLQSKVVDLRGGNAYEHIKELVELGFVTKSKEGRSYSLRLTEKFFEYFDVEGGDSIKQVFKGVIPPKERQKQLGGLQVIDELPLTQKQKTEKEDAALLGGLSVIDELPDAPELDENGVPEAPGRLEESDEEKEEKSDFLSKIESQIDNLSQKNDERDDDEDFKSTATEEAAEGEAAETAGEEQEEASGTEEEAPAEETPEPTDETPEEETPEPKDPESTEESPEEPSEESEDEVKL